MNWLAASLSQSLSPWRAHTRAYPCPDPTPIGFRSSRSRSSSTSSPSSPLNPPSAYPFSPAASAVSGPPPPPSTSTATISPPAEPSPACATSRCLRLRDSSAPLATFTLHSWRPLAIKTASGWLTCAYSLGLRTLHLDIYAGDFESLLPLIVTFHSLRCLRVSSDHCNFPMPGPYSRSLESTIPPSLLATGLRILQLKVWISGPDLKRLVMEQTDLEDLCLDIPSSIPLDLASTTVKNTKLIFNWGLPGLSLAFPALVVLDLTMSIGEMLKKFHAVMMPLLRKADIKIWSLEEESVPVLGDLLRCLVNVSQLSIHIQRSYLREPDSTPALSARRRKQLRNCQFHLLVEPGKDLPTFPHLRSLKLLMHFHEDGISDLICFLQNAPVLESVEAHHVDNDSGTAVEGCWKSRLPQDSEGNNQNAHFSNLHLSDNKIELIGLLALCNERHQKKPGNDLQELKR